MTFASPSEQSDERHVIGRVSRGTEQMRREVRLMHAGDAAESGNLAGTDSVGASAPIPAFDFASAGASTRVDRDCATNSRRYAR